MSLSDKITVVIPTHERQDYLKRSLDYWSRILVNILVADSSKKKNMNVNQFLNTRYIHYPGWGYVNKLIDVLNNVDTEYVVLCADDDYILKDALKKCVIFLDNNGEYITAHGHYCNFRQYSPGPLINSTISWSPKFPYISPSLSNSDPFERLYNHFIRYTPLFYAVSRTVDLRYSWNKAREYGETVGFNYTPFFEILPSCIQVVRGKSKRLDALYGVRENIKGSAGQTLLQYHQIFLRPDFQKEYESFRKILMNELTQIKSDINIYKTQSDFDLMFSIFFEERLIAEKGRKLRFHKTNNSLSKKEMINKLLYYSNLLGLAKSSNGFIRRIKNAFLVWTMTKKYNKNDFSINWWLNIFKQAHDISEIKKHVIKFSKNI